MAVVIIALVCLLPLGGFVNTMGLHRSVTGWGEKGKRGGGIGGCRWGRHTIKYLGCH